MPRSILVEDSVMAALLTQVLTQQQASLRIDQPHAPAVPLHVQAAADPARRCAVVRGADLDTSVEMHGALAVLVVPEGLDGQRLQMGLSSANITATCRFVVPWIRESAQWASHRSR